MTHTLTLTVSACVQLHECCEADQERKRKKWEAILMPTELLTNREWLLSGLECRRPGWFLDMKYQTHITLKMSDTHTNTYCTCMCPTARCWGMTCMGPFGYCESRAHRSYVMPWGKVPLVGTSFLDRSTNLQTFNYIMSWKSNDMSTHYIKLH